MKHLIKSILVLLLLFTVPLAAQEYFGTAVELGVTPVAGNNDLILANGTHSGNANTISKTAITVQQLNDVITAGVPNLQSVLTSGNTAATSIQLSSGVVEVKYGTVSTGTLNGLGVHVVDPLRETRMRSGHWEVQSVSDPTAKTVFSFLNPTINATVRLRNISGDVALTSELPDLANYCNNFSNQSFGGFKTWTNTATFAGSINVRNSDPFIDISSTTDSSKGGKIRPSLTQTSGARTWRTPDVSGQLALKSDIVAKISAATALLTRAELNTNYPLFDNPIGTMVVNKFGSNAVYYVRVAATEWVRFTGIDIP
ncbi:MAG: hypothetical protein ACPGRW_06300 [Flavobacteriaceae bacterium]